MRTYYNDNSITVYMNQSMSDSMSSMIDPLVSRLKFMKNPIIPIIGIINTPRYHSFDMFFCSFMLSLLPCMCYIVLGS